MYNALQQHDHHDHDRDEDGDGDGDGDGDNYDSPSPNPRHMLASPVFTPPLSASLFWDGLNANANANANTSHEPSYPHTNALGLNYLVQSIASRSTRTDASYDMVESEDFTADARSSPALSKQSGRGLCTGRSPPGETSVQLHIPRARRRSPATATATATAAAHSTTISPQRPSQPVPRTASGRRIALRHPTPDLQVLQGAYTGNILHLEKTAEQLSMTSSMDDAIRELHDEQKRSDSRRSSLLSTQDMSAISRQVSNASSIVEVNSAARSGGFSPAGFMISPKGSFTAGVAAGGRGRSASKSSRYGSRPEPELEGRPLDSFVNMHSMSSMQPPSPMLSRSASIAEQDEESTTMTKPIAELFKSPEMDETPRGSNKKTSEERERPATSASIGTFDQAQMFADFDGIHSGPLPVAQVELAELADTVDMSREMGDSPKNDSHQRRPSGGRILSGGRPQSYADPHTGQEMVYYPAPVPMMLNLPQKLSKAPSSMARNKRRSQVMSNIPAAARQSAIWLPDVLENEEDGPLAEDDEAQQQEYIPQHQRASMGGRRLTQDLSHMPAQLRANAFFDLPAATQMVAMKEQSAVATLDSILDASAFAPVNAFTDHAFAGALGAEVYGKEKSHDRNSRSTTQLLDPEQHKKRTSSFNLLLRGRRASSSDLLDTDKRKSTMSGVIEATVRSPIEEDGDEGFDEDDLAVKAVEDEEEEDEGQLDNNVYHGPPTTLLAELQLRKQQQKQRTQHLTKQFPTGIHSTLLEMDAVAQVQQKSRKNKRTILAWEDPNMLDQGDEDGDDEDVPLAMLYAKKSAQLQDANRPLGLMERRDMEDNEPLSRRRDRLQGRPPAAPRASTMMNLSGPTMPSEEEEGETLAQRVRRLKDQSGTLPAARPVSGDFTSELMSQFGGGLLDKGKGKEVSPAPPEEEETLAQRRTRLQTERDARAKEVGTTTQTQPPPYTEAPPLNKRRSMADILAHHPSAGADRVVTYQKPPSGLLGLHERKSSQRASTMLDFPPANAKEFVRKSSGFKAGQYNDGQGGIIPPQQQWQFPQPSLGAGMGGYGSQMNLAGQSSYNLGGQMPQMQMGYMPAMPMQQGISGLQGYGGGGVGGMSGMSGMMNMNMNIMKNMSMLQMGMGQQPLNQGQIDMVERWRQSVLQ